MYCLPVFYVGNDVEKLEKEYRRVKMELGFLKSEVKHYYYGKTVIDPDCWVEDTGIGVSLFFENAYSGGLNEIERCLANLAGGKYMDDIKKREEKRERVYKNLARLTYREKEDGGNLYTYVADFEGERVVIYKTVEDFGGEREGRQGFGDGDEKDIDEYGDDYFEIDKRLPKVFSKSHDTELLLALKDCLGRDTGNLGEAERERYLSETRRMMKEAAPFRYFEPRKCDMNRAEKDRNRTVSEIFLSALLSIEIDGWAKRYRGKDALWDCPDTAVRENACPEWKLILEYSDGKKPLTYSGVRDCPYNLSLVTRLLDGIDDSGFFDDDHINYCLDFGEDHEKHPDAN